MWTQTLRRVSWPSHTLTLTHIILTPYYTPTLPLTSPAFISPSTFYLSPSPTHAVSRATGILATWYQWYDMVAQEVSEALGLGEDNQPTLAADNQPTDDEAEVLCLSATAEGAKAADQGADQVVTRGHAVGNANGIPPVAETRAA